MGLGGGARVAIKNESLLGKQRLEAVSHDVVDQLVGHQLPGRHNRADPLAGDRVLRDLPTQDLAGADVHQPEALSEPHGLRPLARARGAEHDHLMRGKARHLELE